LSLFRPRIPWLFPLLLWCVGVPALLEESPATLPPSHIPSFMETAIALLSTLSCSSLLLITRTLSGAVIGLSRTEPLEEAVALLAALLTLAFEFWRRIPILAFPASTRPKAFWLEWCFAEDECFGDMLELDRVDAFGCPKKKVEIELLLRGEGSVLLIPDEGEWVPPIVRRFSLCFSIFAGWNIVALMR
jgi:hypothetical protein